MNSIFKIVMSTALLLAVAGCSSDGGGSSASTTTAAAALTGTLTGSTTYGIGNDPATTGYISGSTAQMTNNSGLYSFFYNSRPYQPTNVRVNIDLSRAQSTVVISYQEGVGGRLVQTGLGSVHPFYPGVQDTSYNGWYQESGRRVYKAFFQDQYGAIVLIMHQALDGGDGIPTGLAAGEIWFQNFIDDPYDAGNQGPLKMCWQISLGPYDCRSFLVNNRVDMNSSDTPTTIGPSKSTPYQKLGEFTGIDVTYANTPAN